MACIEKIYSVSALIGSGLCNGNCSFCAGKVFRGSSGSDNYYKNLESAIKLSARYGGWSLSLTSSGEPTCEPDALTKVLKVYNKCVKQGAYFPSVNLFTNGIILADPKFCEKYLPLWKSLGLTNIAVSIHGTNEFRQALAYSIESYPYLPIIFGNIKLNGLGLRCTLLLRKGWIDDSKTYKEAVLDLLSYGVDNITSWPLGNSDGSRNEFTPSRLGLLGIRWWLHKNAKFCHGHIWGGGVYDYKGNILRLTSYVTKHNPSKDFVRQLVVFNDGTVAYSWIKGGSFMSKVSGKMTRKQLVQKVRRLLKPREFVIKIFPSNYIYLTAQWNSYIHPEIVKIDFRTSWKGLDAIDFCKALSLLSSLLYFRASGRGNKLNFIKLVKFNAEIVAVCKESDRQAKELKIDRYKYFDDILFEAKEENK